MPVVGAVAAAVAVAALTSRWWYPPPRRPGDDVRDSSTRDRSRATVVVTRPTLVLGALLVALVTTVALTSPPVGVLIAVGGGVGWRHTSRRRHIERRAAQSDQLPELVDALVTLVHAGLAPPLAWRELLTCCPDSLRDAVHRVVAGMDHGVTFADALSAFVDDVGPPAHPLVDTLVTAERYGLPLGPVLTRLSTDAAAHRRRTVEARARQLPVRLSFPVVLCTLPSFVLLAVAPVIVTALSSLPRP